MQPLRGIFLKVSSVTIFVVMASLIKAASAEVPPGQSVFFRSFFAIPVILMWLGWQGALPRGLKTTRPGAHIWRGVVGTSAMGLGFAALGLLPLPEVTAIGYAAPVLVVVLAAIFLKETIGVFRIGAVLLGLAGVIVVISPRLGVIQSQDAGLAEVVGVALVLASAFCAAIAQVTVRTMVRTESTASIVFYFSVTATLLACLTAPFGWVWPSAQALAMLVLAGILGGLGQILLTSSYRFADVSVIAPFEYASILLAVVSGYLFFNEVPTVQTLIGSALVIFAGISIILREHWLGLRRGRARLAMTPGDK